LMQEARDHIKKGDFKVWKNQTIEKLNQRI